MDDFKGNYEYGLTESRILSSIYTIPSVNEWALRLVAVYNMAKGKFAPLIQSKVFAVSEQISAQIAYTLVPFVDSLINNSIRLATSLFVHFILFFISICFIYLFIYYVFVKHIGLTFFVEKSANWLDDEG